MGEIYLKRKKGLRHLSQPLEIFGAPGRIRTCDLRIRSPIFGLPRPYCLTSEVSHYLLTFNDFDLFRGDKFTPFYRLVPKESGNKWQWQ